MDILDILLLKLIIIIEYKVFGGICEINLFLIVKIENIIFVLLYFVLFFYFLV